MMNDAHVDPLALRPPRGQSVGDADIPGHGRSSSLSPGLYIRARGARQFRIKN